MAAGSERVRRKWLPADSAELRSCSASFIVCFMPVRAERYESVSAVSSRCPRNWIELKPGGTDVSSSAAWTSDARWTCTRDGPPSNSAVHPQ